MGVLLCAVGCTHSSGALGATTAAAGAALEGLQEVIRDKVGISSTHDAYESKRKCGELKLFFSPIRRRIKTPKTK